ncbi:histone deacetylase family protein [Nisaea sediminum]|uniref:histone deacetylase family protein n=1 Tax=Nisaea sediminum TaxID=2775867 RepID=UPI00186909A9|nr:histone deacetylase family protein [Nisaea sediminum]
MRVVYTEGHAAHAPKRFIMRGAIGQCPEKPERAEILFKAAREAGHETVPAKTHGVGPAARIHDEGYLDFLENGWARWCELPDHADEIVPNVHSGRNMSQPPQHIVAQAGHYQADTACPIGAGTWQGALASSDVAVTAADLLADDLDAGKRGAYLYALCRPPGHHAYADQAGGFCFLNNSAIAAQRLRDRGAAKVAILDVDVHHGNGTQGIFYTRGDVLTVSLHGDPADYYPFFTGFAHETGEGDGAGANVNYPLPRGTGDDAYLEILKDALDGVAAYKPDALVVALGLDASEADPLAYCKITTDGFRRMGRAIAEAGHPSLLVQEGGYISDQLGANLAAFLGGFEQARG